jgi:aspartyl protease family protein
MGRTARSVSCFWLAVLPFAVQGADVALAGVIGARAVLVIDAGAPQTLAVGARSREGVKLVALRDEIATVEVDGRRETLRLGEHAVHVKGGQQAARLQLQADSQGHFVSRGRINGIEVNLLVDTGATFVSLGRSDAKRIGLDYTKGERGLTATANGTVPVWRMRLDTVELGGMTLHNVDASVHESELPLVLLGMSFLNRTQWQRDGDKLILQKRY